MKRFFSAVAATAIATSMSATAFAHSYIGETSPADGETVTEALQEITLNFDGNIEQGSYIDVTSATGTAVDVTTTIGDGQLIGTFAEPLPNEDYTVDWSIISEDGHPLEGAYTFTVNAPIEEVVAEEQVTEETEDVTTDENEATETPNETTNEEEEVTGPSATMLIAVVVGIIALVGGVFFFLRKN